MIQMTINQEKDDQNEVRNSEGIEVKYENESKRIITISENLDIFIILLSQSTCDEYYLSINLDFGYFHQEI